MSASDIRAYLNEEEVLDEVELGNNQVIAATKLESVTFKEPNIRTAKQNTTRKNQL